MQRPQARGCGFAASTPPRPRNPGLAPGPQFLSPESRVRIDPSAEWLSFADHAGRLCANQTPHQELCRFVAFRGAGIPPAVSTCCRHAVAGVAGATCSLGPSFAAALCRQGCRHRTLGRARHEASSVGTEAHLYSLLPSYAPRMRTRRVNRSDGGSAVGIGNARLHSSAECIRAGHGVNLTTSCSAIAKRRSRRRAPSPPAIHGATKAGALPRAGSACSGRASAATPPRR